MDTDASRVELRSTVAFDLQSIPAPVAVGEKKVSRGFTGMGGDKENQESPSHSWFRQRTKTIRADQDRRG
jgi:hypothetical protein